MLFDLGTCTRIKERRMLEEILEVGLHSLRNRATSVWSGFFVHT